MTKNKYKELEELEEWLTDSEKLTEKYSPPEDVEIELMFDPDELDDTVEIVTSVTPTLASIRKAILQAKEWGKEGMLEDMLYSDESVILRELKKLEKQHKKQKEKNVRPLRSKVRSTRTH